MTACRDRDCFADGICLRNDTEKACVVSVLEKHRHQIHGEVIELGYGVWKQFRRLCWQQDVIWKGVEPRLDFAYSGKNHYYHGSATNIPFPDNSQDWVVAFETIEHWGEPKCPESPADGVVEIHRVLKPGGKFLVTCPIHWHGTNEFYFGDLKTIRRYFEDVPWSSIEYDEWRRDHEPLPKKMHWKETKGDRPNQMLKQLGYEPTTWRLEVLATK